MKRRRRARRCARPEHDAGADRPRPAPPTQVGHENVRRAARYFDGGSAISTTSFALHLCSLSQKE